MKKAALLLLCASGVALADNAAIQKCRALTDSAARLSCYDAIPLAATAPEPSRAAAPAAAPVAPATQQFGFEAQRKKEAELPSSIESTIVGNFSGWGPGAQITLANGQVWRVIDGSEAVLPPAPNRKARVERNFFGTLFMVIEGTNHSPKVRRVK